MLRRAFASFVLLVASGSVVALGAPPASAQELTKAELSQARAKFQQAIELEHAGNWAGALSAFREVGQVRMTPQVRYHIANCEEKLGKLVIALGGYELALQEAEGMQPEFIAEVQGAIEQLKARIPKLVIQRGDGAEAATIELDGVTLGSSSIGIETPVDPGPHTISARAPGRAKYTETVNVSEQESKTLTVALEELPSDVPVAAADPGSGGDVKPAEGGPKYGIYPYVLGGVGVAGLAASGVFFAMNQSKVGELEKNCPDRTNCAKGDEAKYDSAKTDEMVAWVAGGLGLASLGTGVALYLLDHQKPKQEAEMARSRRVQVLAGAPGAHTGLTVRGAF